MDEKLYPFGAIEMIPTLDGRSQDHDEAAYCDRTGVGPLYGDDDWRSG
jgi:hypothetical protein